MSKAKSTEIATTQSTAIALPDDLLAQMAADAKDAATLERPSVANISLRAGMLSYQGEAVKGNKLRVVILAAASMNTYYTKKWDPDNPSNPACFALSERGTDMAPHENVSEPVSDKCETCAMYQWGSDPGGGRGKACKETRRLVMLPESALDSVEDIVGAELAMMKLPVTSVKVWGNFVNSLNATVQLPYYAVVTEVTTQPDIKTQFKVVMTPVDRIPDADILRALMSKREEAMRIAMLPFESTEQTEESAVKEKF